MSYFIYPYVYLASYFQSLGIPFGPIWGPIISDKLVDLSISCQELLLKYSKTSQVPNQVLGQFPDFLSQNGLMGMLKADVPFQEFGLGIIPYDILCPIIHTSVGVLVVCI